MKILIVSDAFWPDDTGGITNSLLNEVKGLIARGHQIIVVTRRLWKDLAPYEKCNGYELYRYLSPAKGSIFYRTYPFFSLTQLPKLAKKLHMFHCDIVYVHNPFQMIGLQRVGLNVPIIYTFHAPTLREIEIDAKRGKYGFLTSLLAVAKPFVRMTERQALYQADLVLVRSQFMRREMEYLYGNIDSRKVALLPLAVDTLHFKFGDDSKAIRKSLGLPEDQKILLTVRRLAARMGLENLIDAMKLVTRRHPQALLLIGGKGYLENALRERIRSCGLENHIRLIGFIPEEKLPSYYQAADLFVLPTTELEGFGLATIEALSCGTPVISTPVGANPEVVGPLGSEFLCSDATAEALAERIIWWLDRGVFQEIRQLCRDYCTTRFSINLVAASLERLFIKTIISKSKKE